jgi:mycothiol synthase
VAERTSVKIRDYAPGDLEALRAVVRDTGVAPLMDNFQDAGGTERLLADPHLHPGAVRLAIVAGHVAGFAVSYLLPHHTTPFAMTRVCVTAAARGHGAGSALLAAADHWLAHQSHAPVARGVGGAWMPEPAAEAMAARAGYTHERWFWLMERPRGAAPEPVWPEGVQARVWDGSDAMLDDLVCAYNDSFANHYNHVPAAPEDFAHLLRRAGTAPERLVIAYRGALAAGFCMCDAHEVRGEIVDLGTTHAARGIGLGRALLRWGVRWLEANTTTPVTLLVDGDNESALTLYKSEGFEVVRTRRVWTKRMGA